MKKEKKPGIFFVNPSAEELPEGTKNTVETILKVEDEPADTDNLTGDFKKIIDVKYGQDKKGNK